MSVRSASASPREALCAAAITPVWRRVSVRPESSGLQRAGNRSGCARAEAEHGRRLGMLGVGVIPEGGTMLRERGREAVGVGWRARHSKVDVSGVGRSDHVVGGHLRRRISILSGKYRREIDTQRAGAAVERVQQ
jgi:hypothetical protein